MARKLPGRVTGRPRFLREFAIAIAGITAGAVLGLATMGFLFGRLPVMPIKHVLLLAGIVLAMALIVALAIVVEYENVAKDVGGRQ